MLTLAMVIVLDKFRHYLLGFVFYVNHMMLIYLVNKTQVYGGCIFFIRSHKR
jgi:hypothetical protein